MTKAQDTDALDRPTLLVQTVYFDPDERSIASSLGGELYHRLTRPRGDRLAFGAGIPVLSATNGAHVDITAAQQLLIVPVLGIHTFRSPGTRKIATKAISDWHLKLGEGHVVPVFAAESWRNEEGAFLGRPVLKHLYSDKPDTWDLTIIEVVLAACRLLGSADLSLSIFISHAKADLQESHEVAVKIRNFAKDETKIQEAFFDATDLEPGKDLSKQLHAATSRGVFLAVRTDSYASRRWCQHELLWAKQAGIPTLSVEVLHDGEQRSYPYGGNSPTIVWTAESSAERVVQRAFVEWLKARHFQLDALRIAGDLPHPIIVPRPPELLDLAQGPLLHKGAIVVLHPDPELSNAERQVLRDARPRMRLVTPSTLYRSALQRGPADSSGAATWDRATEPANAPLFGKQIALSLSTSPDARTAELGVTAAHLDDAIVHVARALISAGAAIAYGGDFREGGYDALLAELIVAYNNSGVKRSDYLYSYLSAAIPKDATLEDLPISALSLAWSKEVSGDAVVPPPESGKPTDGARRAACGSDMRRVMAKYCFGRVMMAGQAKPSRNGPGEGYEGAYPDLLEEAWWALTAGAPIYIVGGFGGATQMLADLFEHRTTPESLRAESFPDDHYSEFRERSRAFAADPHVTTLGVPRTMVAMVEALRALGGKRLASDASSDIWNGLSLAENRTLFRTREPFTIARLVMKGLFKVAARKVEGKLNVELVRGSITQVEGADALAIATFRDVALGGAGAALDQALSHRITTARKTGERLVETSGREVDADWLILEDLGDFADLGAGSFLPLYEAIQNSAERIARVAVRHGFRSLGIVSLGANVAGDLKQVVDRMVTGFRPAAAGTALQWFEIDEDRFHALRALLEVRPDVALTTRVLPVIRAPDVPRANDWLVTVRYGDGVLHSTLLPPQASSAAAIAWQHPLDAARFSIVTRSDDDGSLTPAALEVHGAELMNDVLDEAGKALLEGADQGRLFIHHDVESGRLPFESMRLGDQWLALHRAVTRRPALPGLRSCEVGRRPTHVGKLNLLLVVNPTDDLEGAEEEARTVEQCVHAGEYVAIAANLEGKDASLANVLAALRDPSIDVLHYIGRLSFTQQGSAVSGLVCSDGELIASKLVELPSAPRVVFFNPRRSAGERRRAGPDVTQAFAEAFLQGSVEAYLGTLWPVGDVAAASFSTHVYRSLARGQTLDAAVLLARRALEQAKRSDWANYVLYGDGGFRIVKRR